MIAIRANSDFDELLFAEPAVHAIRDAVRELGLDPDARRARPHHRHDGAQLRGARGGRSPRASWWRWSSLVLFTVAVCFGLRSLRVLLALVASLIASLVWTNAFAAAAIGHLNQVSVAFNVLIIGLGGELGIHVCMRYRSWPPQGRTRAPRRWR